MAGELPDADAAMSGAVKPEGTKAVERQETVFAEKVQMRLTEAQKARARRAMRITVPCFAAACFAMRITVCVPGGWKVNVGSPLAGLPAFTMLMGLLPSQRRTIQVVTLINVLSFISLIMNGVRYVRNFVRLLQPEPELTDAEREDPLWYQCSLQLASALSIFFLVGVGVWLFSGLCRKLNSPTLLRNLWRMAFMVTVNLALFSVGELVLGIAAGKMADSKAASVVIAIVCRAAIALAASRPNLRIVCQSWLARRHGKEDQAAGLAALIGGRGAKEVMDGASRQFRCVSLDRVFKGDMAGPRPDPALHALTEAASLGEVDAFLSHSWSDKPEDKWKAMQQWRAAFKAKNGREPKVWIDKYCIDQTRIEESLAGLPVFLSGCRKLVVFPGHTYTSRLWCMMELLTFITMGGDPQDVVAVQMGDHAVDWSCFDVQRATCTDPKDNAHLLQVLEDFSGTASIFSNRIQALFASSSNFTPLAAPEEAEGATDGVNQLNVRLHRDII